ncbi:MAG: two-component system, OmpR family, KDP operon response regulator KdpE [Alphaproteobacteria bacterium]|nr:two-component system, OmpR family, KDP operon response regulator KdpE [Alphaproteobacteria bacterium]
MADKKNTILVVDDEPHIHKMLGILLDVENFKIAESTSGKQAIRMCASVKPDLMLLDLGLPDMDGKEVISAVREWSQVPIIVLSVSSSDDEITMALNLGANDYVTKPFNVGVLMARINAALRSSAVQETGEPELCNGPLRMDLVRHEVFLHDKLQAFTPKEYDLLRHFMVNRGKMLTHREILKKVWGAAHAEDTTYLRVYIGQIRGKIEENPAAPVLITTEPGIGYRMEVV